MEDLNEEKKSSKKTIIIIAVVALLAIAAAVGGALFFLGKLPGLSDQPVESSAPAGPQITPSNSVYYKLDPAFVVNFHAGRKQRFMQVYVAIKAQSEDALAEVERHAPLIRNDLNILFAKQDFESIQTPEGKEEMRQAATKAIQDVLAKYSNGATIDEVLFTNLVMQ